MSRNRSNSPTSLLHRSLLRIVKIQFIFIALLAGQIVVFDAWQLITPEAALKRWIAVGVLFGLTTVIWYILSGRKHSKPQLHSLVWWLIAADILFASYYVYLGRGVASKSVALYAIPITISAILLSRRALVSTALLCSSAYLVAVMAYATLHFNEGYKIERYGEIFFFAGVMLVLAAMLGTMAKIKKRL